jgi:secondary thiamine-phosphate synthase enzyme
VNRKCFKILDIGLFMKTHTEKLILHTKNRKEIVNITSQVQESIDKSGIKEGIVLVNSMHITSSVFINDEENGLKEDFMGWLEKLAPYDLHKYRHHRTGEDNADAHLKRTIMGREVVVAISDGKLDFGPWEEIFYGEFDGQRDKRVMVKVIGE